MIPRNSHSLISALSMTALLSATSAGCVGAPEDVAFGEDEILTYDAGIHSSVALRRTVRYDANPVKVFDIGRIQPGTSVTTHFTRTSGSGNIVFDLQFSADGTTWPTLSAASPCGTTITTSTTAELTCTRTSAATDVYARLRVEALVAGASAEFVFSESHTARSNDVHHSHYATDTLSIPANGWSENGSGPDRQWLYIGLKDTSIESNPMKRRLLPGALQFQRIVMTIVRSGSAVELDHLDGPRLMERTELNTNAASGPAVEITDFDCPQGSTGAFTWTGNTITCSIDVVPRDGFIHVPLSRPDTNTTATATVTIARTSPRAAGTGSVRSELSAAITNNYLN